MSTETAAVATPAVKFDFSARSASELESRFRELTEEKTALEQEIRARVEALQRLVPDVTHTPVVQEKPKVKRGRKKREAGAEGTRGPSLKTIVQGILEENPDGLDLGGILAKVKEKIDRGEYHSKATKLPAVVSQAVHTLKAEKVIEQNKETKKYSKAKEAA